MRNHVLGIVIHWGLCVACFSIAFVLHGETSWKPPFGIFVGRFWRAHQGFGGFGTKVSSIVKKMLYPELSLRSLQALSFIEMPPRVPCFPLLSILCGLLCDAYKVHMALMSLLGLKIEGFTISGAFVSTCAVL